LETVISTLFPRARILRVDRDTLQSKKRTAEFFEKMQKREVDIILGTQLLAKGHDYPHITLVGVVDADLNLNFPDFRAEERVYQELLQVSGRAGRAHAQGEVFVQTMNPEHPIYKFLTSDTPETFWKEELEERRRFGYPPWKAFVQIECSGVRAAEVSATCKRLFDALKAELPSDGSLSLLGPAPAPIEKVRGRYRWLFLVRGDQRKTLKAYLWRHVALFEKAPPAVRVSIDVDPYSMM
jgi:primosomal protein N' (replication factor Y)